MIDRIVEVSAARPSPFSQVLIQHVHGEVRRVRPAATAFALRNVPYVMNMLAAWNANDAPEDERHMQWVRAFQAAIQPFTESGVYMNRESRYLSQNA